MDSITNVFKILSDETRLRMLLLLFKEDLCVCQLSGILKVPQPRISKNLSKLRDLSLVSDNRQEKYVYYSLKKENTLLIFTIKNIIDNLEFYPQLLLDNQRISDKEKYLIKCCI
ncbi:MAG: winged helix-turn-helix transcriptional regulator [Spirochaetales bacterium]|nr:winged helix-turn-helix transcriptional regulator [Spirochaetales bacterium]